MKIVCMNMTCVAINPNYLRKLFTLMVGVYTWSFIQKLWRFRIIYIKDLQGNFLLLIQVRLDLCIITIIYTCISSINFFFKFLKHSIIKHKNLMFWVCFSCFSIRTSVCFFKFMLHTIQKKLSLESTIHMTTRTLILYYCKYLESGMVLFLALLTIDIISLIQEHCWMFTVMQCKNM